MPKRHFRVDPPTDAAPDELRAWNDLNRQLSELTDALYHIRIEPGGTLEFVDDGTVWDDLRVPLSAVRVGATKPPSFSAFLGTIFSYDFSASTREHVHFVCQMPHSYKHGTNLHPHLHWTPTDTTTGSVTWGLEYTWADIGRQFPTPSTIYCRQVSNQVSHSHHLVSFDPISPHRETGNIVSSILVCHLYRHCTDTLDTYAADAALLEFDFHFEKDTIGSKEEYSK